MKHTRHNWTVAEKKELLRLSSLNTPKSHIRNLMFPDESVTVAAVQKMAEILKKNPGLAEVETKARNYSTITTSRKKRTYTKRRKPLHYWSVPEKLKIQSLMNEGKTPKKIRLELYKSDRTVSLTSLTSVISRIKKDPSWANQHPSTNTPGNPNFISKPVSDKHPRPKKSSSKRKSSTNHFWTPEERKLLLANKDKPSKWIKKNIFNSDRTITPKGISMQIYFLRNGKLGIENIKRGRKTAMSVAHPTRNLKVSRIQKLLPQSFNRNGSLTLEDAAIQYVNHKKEVTDFMVALTSFIDSKSPFTPEQQSRIHDCLNQQSELAIQEKHNELLSSIEKVN